MIKTYTHRRVAWIDVESPTREDVNSLLKAYDLSALVGEELLGPSKVSKAAAYKNYLYLVLRFPVRVRAGSFHLIEEKEIDFILGTSFIITGHYEFIQPLHAFEKTFEASSILDKEKTPDHAGHVFYTMMRRLYTRMLADLDSIKKELAVAEEGIFAGKEKAMVEVLSNLSRELLDFRQACRSHFEILESLEKASPEFFDKAFGPYINGIKEDFLLVRDAIANSRELSAELRETNNSLLTTKQNETIKVLTVVAFVTFPLSLILEIFSLPSDSTPLVRLSDGWEIIVGIMFVASLAMIWYFRRKKWL